MIIGWDRDAIRGPEVTVENIRKYYPEMAGQLTDERLEQVVEDTLADHTSPDPFDDVDLHLEWALEELD